ncbi:hypothetical protein EJ110_NYTH14930 [Nymphaea thermarum]|nr:hypothetical protein EJ110_NYTH14930 [Nymphaea thermarum]
MFKNLAVPMEGSSSRNDSLVWTDAQLDHLINLLVEQSRLPDMKSDANLKPKAYKAIERQMIELFGPEFKVEKIKNKLKSTKADYNVCRQILSTSGFGWDPTNQCVDVENEVWAEYIQFEMSNMMKVAFLYVLHSVAVMLSDEEERNLVMLKVMFVVVIIISRLLTQPRQIVHPFRNAGSRFVDNIINDHPRNCLDLMRMDRNSFITLCNMLKEKNLVEYGREISVEEQVAIFLLTVGHNERNRACQNTFQHSGQTISKYVNIIVRALCQLGEQYISRPKIRFNPYFQDCLGVIDGTHIPVWVHTSEQSRFRNRKGTVSQNVLAVVGFDMRFHYVLVGWEGTATDSRVLYSALDSDGVVCSGVVTTGDSDGVVCSRININFESPALFAPTTDFDEFRSVGIAFLLSFCPPNFRIFGDSIRAPQIFKYRLL